MLLICLVSVFRRQCDLLLGPGPGWCDFLALTLSRGNIMIYLWVHKIFDVSFFSYQGFAYRRDCYISLCPASKWHDSPHLPGPCPQMKTWLFPGPSTQAIWFISPSPFLQGVIVNYLLAHQLFDVNLFSYLGFAHRGCCNISHGPACRRWHSSLIVTYCFTHHLLDVTLLSCMHHPCPLGWLWKIAGCSL